ncbi:MAG: hypothetical protein JNM03_02380 [Sphingopyxis sp.]|jgi:hypothetical protein|uniref:hypothetical protein n=2 Tax=Sphingopyxis TaxID=165697 RepID=UPI001A59227E|nr:hypothetical protein [Sphingopyxis sp.]MBL9068822.1 hypothetical protein [Sphingopyxis sp.]
MTCYYQGCTSKGTTKEHIPPKAFFPEGERDQLLTVRSCPHHNNAKSNDDLYVLAHICMNASPSNRAREVWEAKVVPQLSFNGDKFREMLAAGAKPNSDGVKYPVNKRRFDDFFTALSCGLIYKSQKSPLPTSYRIGHIYHAFTSDADPAVQLLEAAIGAFYSGPPIDSFDFGKPNLQNERIYTAEIFGHAGFGGHITIAHCFFGTFKVTSMLSKF